MFSRIGGACGTSFRRWTTAAVALCIVVGAPGCAQSSDEKGVPVDPMSVRCAASLAKLAELVDLETTHEDDRLEVSGHAIRLRAWVEDEGAGADSVVLIVRPQGFERIPFVGEDARSRLMEWIGN